MNDELSKEKIEEIRDYLKNPKNSEDKIYWDYRDELSDGQAVRILKGELSEVKNEIYELNSDYIYEKEVELINSACEACGIEIDDFDQSYLRDLFIEFISVSCDIESLMRKKDFNVRICLYSNYDCINSHFFETTNGGYEYPDSYFANTIDVLNLNPIKVQAILTKHDVSTSGEWLDIPERDGKELISYGAFWREEENRSCPASLLVFLVKINLRDFVGKWDAKIKTLTIPKGNYCGFYSSMQGGGSTLDAELLRDFTVDLSAQGATEFDHFGLETETKEDGYTIEEAYGVTDKVWGKHAILTFE